MQGLDAIWKISDTVDNQRYDLDGRIALVD